jgi:coiled-coil and C2 domain-containing protein 2A
MQQQDEHGSVDPVLTAGGAPDEGPTVPKWELVRRQKSASARFFVSLEINGQVVPGNSPPTSLRGGGSGSFSMEVQHAFLLTMTRWPDSARLLLFEKGIVMDSFVAGVPVVVPGANQGDPQQDHAPQQYQFSAETPWTPHWEQNGMALIAQIRVGDSAATSGTHAGHATMQTGSTQQYTSGSVFAQCGWVPCEDQAKFGQPGNDVEACRNASLAPPPPPSTAARRAAAAAKVGYADAAYGVFGRSGARGPDAPPADATHSLLRASGAAHLRATLDPLNPDDAALLETLATRDAVRSTGGGGFRLNLNDETMLGYSVKATKRQQLLKLRAKGERPKGSLPGGGVPLFDNDIPDHLLDQTDGDRRETALLSSQLPGLAEADERASRIAEFLNKVKLNVQKGKRVSKAGAKAGQGPVHTDDVVKDSPLPDVTFDLSGMFEWFQPVRKLRPVRRKTAVAESHPDRCELVVNVQKAFNLPQRAARSGDNGAGRGGGRGQGFGRNGGYGQPAPVSETTELSVFVEVSFQGSTKRTRLANGSSPSWQESIGTCCISQIPPTVCQYKTDTFFLFISALPFRAPGGDFSAAALQGCGDVVRITVFDERPESPELGRGQCGGDRQYGTQASDGDVVTSKQYLGSIDIPVAALYKADGGKLEGLLPIELPPVMLGYDTGKQGGRGVSIQARPALSVYIQFNPALAKPEPVARDAGPGEEEALKRHAQNWEKDARSVGRHCKHRPFRAIATDAMGRSVHLSRYCSPTTLPPGFEGATADEATLRQLLRFTHLVPHVSDMDAFNLPPGVDIWTTTAEFLDMCAGDSEEHALLLLGFLLSLGVEAYIILGVSAADSDAAMVFTPGGQGRRPGQTPGSPPIYTPLLDGSLIWDPMAGTMFSAYDAAAGALMGEVAVVFNHTNIWANVGLGAKPHDMRWDLTDYTAWRPFFSQSTLPPRALPTRQRRVQYTSFEPGFYERLAAAVEREAMDAIVKTRQRQHTPFNRRASRALKELLLELESHALMSPEEASGGVPVPNGPPSARVSLAELHHGTLHDLLEGYDIVGYPLNTTFTDAAAIRDLVERTRVAETSRKDVEFAVATHVEPYGCTFVCSVWVYVARLTKKDR